MCTLLLTTLRKHRFSLRVPPQPKKVREKCVMDPARHAAWVQDVKTVSLNVHTHHSEETQILLEGTPQPRKVKENCMMDPARHAVWVQDVETVSLNVQMCILTTLMKHRFSLRAPPQPRKVGENCVMDPARHVVWVQDVKTVSLNVHIHHSEETQILLEEATTAREGRRKLYNGSSQTWCVSTGCKDSVPECAYSPLW